MSKTADYPTTPELNKLKLIKDQSQKIGEFLDVFLPSKGIQLGRPHVHDCNCAGWDHERGRYNPDRDTGYCGYKENEFEAYVGSVNELLAEFFEIDLKKVDQEKQLVLDYLATQQS